MGRIIIIITSTTWAAICNLLTLPLLLFIVRLRSMLPIRYDYTPINTIVVPFPCSVSLFRCSGFGVITIIGINILPKRTFLEIHFAMPRWRHWGVFFFSSIFFLSYLFRIILTGSEHFFYAPLMRVYEKHGPITGFIFTLPLACACNGEFFCIGLFSCMRAYEERILHLGVFSSFILGGIANLHCMAWLGINGLAE